MHYSRGRCQSELATAEGRLIFTAVNFATRDASCIFTARLYRRTEFRRDADDGFPYLWSRARVSSLITDCRSEPLVLLTFELSSRTPACTSNFVHPSSSTSLSLSAGLIGVSHKKKNANCIKRIRVKLRANSLLSKNAADRIMLARDITDALSARTEPREISGICASYHC